MSTLEDKVVFITGAARGIGAQSARIAAARGARVALAGMEPERLSELQRELGDRHVWCECDVTDQAALDRAVGHTLGKLGRIDAVIANAGIANHGTVATSPANAVARTIEVNLIGVTRTVSAAVHPLIDSGGYFLLVSSAAAFGALPGMAAYAASKSGVEAFGEALRLELAHKGVAVGVAHPGWIDTDMVRDAKKDFATFGEMQRRLPWPLNTTTSIDVCAGAFVDAIERRKRKVYVPESLALVAALRWVTSSRVGAAVLTRQAKAQIPRLEAEVQALGRAFGSTCVETTVSGEGSASSAE